MGKMPIPWPAQQLSLSGGGARCLHLEPPPRMPLGWKEPEPGAWEARVLGLACAFPSLNLPVFF